MEYIRELNAFRNWAIINCPSTGEVALYHTLMSVDSMTGWKEWFTAPNTTLGLLTGLSRQGIDQCRNRLMQRGIIEYRKSTAKNQAGIYRIVPFTSDGKNLVTELVSAVDSGGVTELVSAVAPSLSLALPILKDLSALGPNNNNPPIIPPLTAEQERDAMFRPLPLSLGDPEDFLAAYDDSNNAVLLPDTPSPEEEVPPCPADMKPASSSQHTPMPTSRSATARAG